MYRLLATVALGKTSREKLISTSSDQDHTIAPPARGAFVNYATMSIASCTDARDDREASLLWQQDARTASLLAPMKETSQ